MYTAKNQLYFRNLQRERSRLSFGALPPVIRSGRVTQRERSR
ncbi:MAG: hypothetical protein Q4D72_01550 [Capnocytophaga sp.]|nr:hypothetical protein [Capnocytophaga sp.]